MTDQRNKALDLIKIIAILSMVIDHLRYILPEYQNILVTFGRWAFPFFAFLIAANTHRAIKLESYTTLKRYLVNLGIFSIISEIPYRLLVGSAGKPVDTLNVMPTLMLGFLLILIVASKARLITKILLTLPFIICLYYFGHYLEYGIYGVMLMPLFYLMLSSKTNLKFEVFYFLAVVIASMSNLQYFTPIIKLYGAFNPYTLPISISIILAMVSLRFIMFSLIKINVFKIGKWFWWFYPVHMLLIYLLTIVF